MSEKVLGFKREMILEDFISELAFWDGGQIYLRKSNLVKFCDCNKGKKISVVLLAVKKGAGK
jgi:hypothetical protein